jgi:hypothetical protein
MTNLTICGALLIKMPKALEMNGEKQLPAVWLM